MFDLKWFFFLKKSHNIADKHDLIVYSFGVEDVDRHCVVYKKEFKPTEEELDCLRNGEDVYDRKLKELHEKMVIYGIL